jgi:hypothetical protein
MKVHRFGISSSVSAVRCAEELSREMGIFAYFEENDAGISLHSSLRGGARSLGLTFLRQIP